MDRNHCFCRRGSRHVRIYNSVRQIRIRKENAICVCICYEVRSYKCGVVKDFADIYLLFTTRKLVAN